MNSYSCDPTDISREGLVSASLSLCRRASDMKCAHEACARRNGRSSRILFGSVVIMNAVAAFLLAGALQKMLPGIDIVAGLLSLAAAICTGLALTFDYKGKAARHSELSTCYAALVLSCKADTERFKAFQLSTLQFDTILTCNVNIIKELQLRSHGLDSSCIVPREESLGKPLSPPSGVAMGAEVS